MYEYQSSAGPSRCSTVSDLWRVIVSYTCWQWCQMPSLSSEGLFCKRRVHVLLPNPDELSIFPCTIFDSSSIRPVRTADSIWNHDVVTLLLLPYMTSTISAVSMLCRFYSSHECWLPIMKNFLFFFQVFHVWSKKILRVGIAMNNGDFIAVLVLYKAIDSLDQYGQNLSSLNNFVNSLAFSLLWSGRKIISRISQIRK